MELRKAIVDYAMQFLGNRYVHGGQSLKSGTDCSGFTMYVLKEFGYSISRTPQGQYTGAGRKISYSEIQPGDIICYSSNGGRSCTHVAFYIGDGKILHAANSKDGVKISSIQFKAGSTNLPLTISGSGVSKIEIMADGVVVYTGTYDFSR